MNELIQTFNFGVNEVRTAIKAVADVYFCITDFKNCCNISNANPSRFNLDEKGVHKMYTPTNGGMQHLTYINEPNLYRVIFRSNKAEARQFQDMQIVKVIT